MEKERFDNQRDFIFNQNIGSEVIVKCWSYDYNPKATLAPKLKIGKIVGFDTENNPTKYFIKTDEGITHFKSKDLCLLKTHLGDMDDEHAFNIAKIILPYSFPDKKLITNRLSTQIIVTEEGIDADRNHSVKIRFKSFAGKDTLDLGWMSHYNYYNIGDSSTTIEIFQYLQQLSYALPQTIFVENEPIRYSIEELIELGIYRLKQKNNNT